MVTGPTPPPAKSSSAGGWLAVILIVGLLLMIGQCTANKDTSGNSLENVSDTDMNAAGTAEPLLAPAGAARSDGAVEPLDAKAVAAALMQEHAVVSAQGLSGAMIFSQNCYDALGRGFSWSKLDECGGFDAATAARLSDDDIASFEKEAAYFDGETAAGRYLAAATGASEEASEADQRWARVQAKVKPATPAAKSDASEAGADNVDTPTAAEQVAADSAAPH